MNTIRMNERRSPGSLQRMENSNMTTRIPSLVLVGGLFLLLTVATLLFASPALADLPPTSACVTDGTTTTCDLWATTGTLTMPDGTIVPTWGFASTAGVSATVPGPLLLGTEGETMVVTLHNDLPAETVALAFPGQGLMPDLDGVATGQTKVYTFVLNSPGTFLYEAGLTSNGARQVAMGLYGALVVQPITPNQAYADVDTAFDQQELLVLSEIDPVFHNDPNAFALHEYAPRYWLINGQAFSDVPEIGVVPGETLLLRYVNAGIESHWLGLLGLQQLRIGSDGQRLPASYGTVVQSLAAGQTVDALATIPPTAVQNQRFALYDTGLLLHNANQRRASGDLAYGGMMTFLRALTGPAVLPVGPATTLVNVAPSPTAGDELVTLNAGFVSAVTAAEFFTDTLGAAGTGTAMTAGGNAASYDFPIGDLSPWPSGFVTFYVRGYNDVNGWGPVGSAVLNLDKLGPVIRGMSLQPEPSNGSQSVLLRATGDDQSTGRSNVITATYTIDGGLAETMTLARIDDPITAMTATLTITTVGGLDEGLHLIEITAEDELGNLGVPGIVTLTLDLTGPSASVSSLTPDFLDLTGAPQVTSVRLDAAITDDPSNDAQSLLANAEGFVDTVGPDGSGFDLFPTDGLFDEFTEAAYFDIPISAFLYLSQGDHLVCVHGLDSAGNWGVVDPITDCGTITIDRGVAVDTVAPVVNAINVTPNVVARATLIDVTATASDPDLISNIALAEWFVGADPGEGNGTPLEAADGTFDRPTETLAATIDYGTWDLSIHTVYVRAQDSAGNWGVPLSADVQVLKVIYLPLVMRNH